MREIERCCCTCDRNKRVKDDNGNIDCICYIDGHRIRYVENFESSCRRYALDKAYKPGGKWYKNITSPTDSERKLREMESN